MFAVINPYRDADFFDFFSVLAQRFFQGITGQIRFQDLASDEVQILSLLCLCIASAPLGFFLVYRKMTMMANALCHTILLGMVVAFLITRPSVSMTISSGAILSPYKLMIASLITAIITTFLIQLLVQKARVQEDASIGIVFTTLFALGVVLVTLYTKNLHLASEAIMGNIDALDKDDLVLVGGVALFSSLSFIVFFRGFRLSTFDPLSAGPSLS
jgi:manganese/zinc/iron transport system permease protein